LADATAAVFWFDQLAQAVLVIAGAVVYVWLYEGWLSDDPTSSSEENSSLMRLSNRGERMRWRLANAAIIVILLEIMFTGVRSWGILVALVFVATGYLSDGPYMSTRFGGEIELTPSQQATRRRWAIVPAIVVLFKGTDFRQSDSVLAVILVLAGLVFALLILVPEPRE
jgi:hypothetical protein